MFSGIIERSGTVISNRIAEAGTLELAIGPAKECRIGDSVAVNGVCLSAVLVAVEHVTVDVMPETARRTTLGALRAGDRVNIELALRLGDRVGGHLVTGHIDGTARVVSAEADGNSVVVSMSCDPALARQMVAKGSVALDGISLTLVDVGDAGFSVALIPITRERTTAGAWTRGRLVNLETDLIAKQVERSVAQWAAAGR